MFSTIKKNRLIFALFYKNAFCGELSFATEGLFCQVNVHIAIHRVINLIAIHILTYIVSLI